MRKEQRLKESSKRNVKGAAKRARRGQKEFESSQKNSRGEQRLKEFEGSAKRNCLIWPGCFAPDSGIVKVRPNRAQLGFN